MHPSHPETRASLILRLPDLGDVAAWDEFVGIYGPLIFRLAQKSGMQAVDADDLVQEVLTAVAKSVSRWLDRADRGSFRAWLFRIARNIGINLATRRGTRSLAAGGGEVERLLAEIESPVPSQIAEFDVEHHREVMHWAAIQVREVVAEHTWQAFWLTHVLEQPVEDVAQELGVSVGTVYVGRSRVMSRLQKLVQKFEANK